MLNAQPEFEKRALEVEEYISHLENIEQQLGIPPTLMNTMKSSALLMMYNIVESTMTNLLQDVFDHLSANKVSFDSLNDTMKTLILGYSKRKNPGDLVKTMQQSAVSLVVACFDRSNVFSGNLDSKKIRETLKEIGVQTQHGYKETALLKVKAERNDLAHGNKSFSDCGKNYSTQQLRDFHTKTSATLARVIQDFDAFLTSKAYA
jgi:hypothetical protein